MCFERVVETSSFSGYKMVDQTGFTTTLDNLLLQLALETRELVQKRIDLIQQIQNSPDMSPIEIFGMLWISVYDSVFQFLPIFSNFAQILKRSGPTFHNPQPDQLCDGDVLHCLRQMVRHQILTPSTHKSNIQEKKNYIEETKKNIKKLNGEIQQKQNTVHYYKENVKSAHGTISLLLQYEKMLETELERRQDSCNQDMKIFEERIEKYKKIFQQYKEEYCQSPLAKKLLALQAKREEIEKRIRAAEEKVIAEQELITVQGDQATCDSGKTHIESHEKQTLQSRSSSQHQVDTSLLEDLQQLGTETEQKYAEIEMECKIEENSQDQADGCDESNASQVGAVGSNIWAKHEISCELIADAEQKQQGQTAENCNQSTFYGSDGMEKMMNVMEIEDQQEVEKSAGEEGTNDGPGSSSPVRMTAMLNTPTFSLNSSPSTSPGRQESSETQAFVFSLNSGPSTPGFSGFGDGFDVGSNQNEESPFTFTSPYFSNKKSPETKLPGFLFNELESQPEDKFEFSFGSRSPQPGSSTNEPGRSEKEFPFSFNFEKL